MELADVLARAIIAEKIADKALSMAMEAMIKIEAMKQSTHKIEWVNPLQQIQPESLIPKVEEDEEAPPPPQLSPFNAFSGFKSRKEEVDRQSSKSQDIIEDMAEATDLLWDDAVGG